MYGVVSQQGVERDQYRSQPSCSHDPQDGDKREKRLNKNMYQKILGFFRKQLTEEEGKSTILSFII